MPLRVGARARLGQPVVDAHRLQRGPGRELPAQVLAGDELPEARVERPDVVVLEVDLDEGLPVVVALVHLDPVEDVAREVELARGQRAEVRGDVARAVEQQAVPALELGAREVGARLVGEVRRAEELALEVVGPAVDRADDVLRAAAALQHDRLPVPADVGQQLEARRVADEHLRVVADGQRVVVAGLGDHQLVADVAGRAGEQVPHLRVEHAGIAVPGHRELGRGAPKMRGRCQVRHGNTVLSRKINQPNPTTRDACGANLRATPDRFAKSAILQGRVAKTC